MSLDSPIDVAEALDISQVNLGPALPTSTKHEYSSLESLPDEVLITIARSCQGNDKRSMLRKLCLVSKDMERIARQELYREVAIDCYTSLRHLCRTLEKVPELGQYIVNLKLLAPAQITRILAATSVRLPGTTNFTGVTHFERLCSMYSQVLKRSGNLRKLTMMMMDHGQDGLIRHESHMITDSVSEAITKSRGSSSTAAFVSMAKLHHLTSIATLINFFASPDGDTTGVLTVSPIEVLPRSLRSLHIIVDHKTVHSLVGDTALYKAWFQPRDAALEFLEELQRICTSGFPGLRQVEYIWAVTGDDDDATVYCDLELPEFDPRLGFPEMTWPGRPCDGSTPLCCDEHTTIQALSPDVDYTSIAKGIVSPFKERFDNLDADFREVNVAFRITEMDTYDLDHFSHCREDREWSRTIFEPRHFADVLAGVCL